MIQFTAQPDHFGLEGYECFACRWMQAHRNLREWIEARETVSWIQEYGE